MIRFFRDERVRQVAVGVSILLVLTVVIPGLLVTWRKIPGMLGEALGIFLGIMTTPFFMEASFIIIGAMTVYGVNAWHRRKEGDEFVEIEIPDHPAAPPEDLR